MRSRDALKVTKQLVTVLELEPRFSQFSSQSTLHMCLMAQSTNHCRAPGRRAVSPLTDTSPSSDPITHFFLTTLLLLLTLPELPPVQLALCTQYAKNYTGNMLSGTHLKTTNDSNCSCNVNPKKRHQPSASASKQRTKTRFKENANLTLFSANPTLPNDPIAPKIDVIPGSHHRSPE